MTVSEMMRVFNMDMDQFETYAINKGYKFNQVHSSQNFNGVSYAKGNGDNQRIMTLYDKYFSLGIDVSYQTPNSNEFLKIKTEMKNLGFVLYKTDPIYDSRDNLSSQRKIYGNGTYQLTIYTTPKKYNQLLTYEIGLTKY